MEEEAGDAAARRCGRHSTTAAADVEAGGADACRRAVAVRGAETRGIEDKGQFGNFQWPKIRGSVKLPATSENSCRVIAKPGWFQFRGAICTVLLVR
jgi:hypothetical protein